MALGNVGRLVELDASNRKRVVVLGDAMTDVYVSGYLSECQDHCQKFVEQSRVVVPGGALNAVRSLSDWRAHVFPLVQSGPPSLKVRYVAGGKFVFRHDLEHVSDCEESRRHAERALREFEVDALLISDYCKGFLTRELIRFAIEEMGKRGVPCVVDAKRQPDVFHGAVLKCNDAYAAVYPGVLERSNTVVTHGPGLPMVVQRTQSAPALVTRSVQCINHVGAGDCFAAHLTLALAHGFGLADAAAIAHSAGRVYVQHPHNRPPLKAEVLADSGE